MPKTVITFGTFDVLHVGHLRILARASALGDRLVVGVSSDALNRSKKAKDAVFGERSRMRLVGSLRVVDELEQRYAAFDGLNLSWWNAFIGLEPGSMGETSALSLIHISEPTDPY